MYASPYIPFHVEKPSPSPVQPWPAYLNDQGSETRHISALLAAKSKVFAVSGSLPVDQSQFLLFFRTKSGLAHAIDFPVDLEFDMPPAMQVLIAACSPRQTPNYREEEPLFVPKSMSVTTSFDIASHPVIEMVKDALFPTLPDGSYLTISNDDLEILPRGSRLNAQGTPADGRVATLILLLPSACRGGAVVILNADGSSDTFGVSEEVGQMGWIAFLATSSYEVTMVEEGCRMFNSYGVYIKPFGPSVRTVGSLLRPSDRLLESLSNYIQLSRGRTVAFWLSSSYGVNPAEVVAESLVHKLQGGDLVLYHALKLYNLQPELRWSAGGYVWPVDRAIELSTLTAPMTPGRGPITPPIRGTFSGETNGDHQLRFKVESSGAVPIQELGIQIVTDWQSSGAFEVGKERVPMAAGDQVEKMVVNTLLVVEIPYM